MITIHDCKQGSLDWHELRKGKWTGSRAIKLLQGKSLPDDSNIVSNKHMMRGSLLEPIAIQEYEHNAETSVLRPGFITNSKYPNAGYSPDGIVGDTLLEVKCCNGVRHENLVNGDIPLEYLVQVYFGMVICELKIGKLLAFNPEYEQQLTILDIPYDEAIIANIQSKLEYDKMKRNGHHN